MDQAALTRFCRRARRARVRALCRTLLLGLLLVGLPAGAATWSLRVEPEQMRQGGLLFVELESATPLSQPTCEWLGHTYPMYAVRGGYRAMLPVDRLQETGPAALVVRAAGVEEPVASRTLSIVKLDTGPVEIIRLTPDRMALQKDPRLEEEAKRIGEIVRTQSPAPLWKGNFQPPSAEPGRNFGKQRRYIEVRRGRRRGARKRNPGSSFAGYHRGLDFSLERGTPVLAANAGKVLAAEPFVLPGNAVFLDHGQGIISAYFHLEEIRVKAGDLVSQGEVIGTVGNTGRSTGPHLHWQVYAQGRAVNPAAITSLPERFWE